MSDHKCPLCGEDAQPLGPHPQYPRSRIGGIACAQCGHYYLTASLLASLSHLSLDPAQRAKLSAVTREHSEEGNPIILCTGSAQRSQEERIGFTITEAVETMFPRSMLDRVDRSLLNLARKSRHPGDSVEIDASRDRPLLFAETDGALRLTLEHMVQSGVLDQVTAFHQGGGSYRLTVGGWERVEQLRQLRPESRQAFVAMWFNAALDEAWEKGLRPAVEDAGYSPMRVDMAQFNEKIDDYIVAQIRRSRFLVVDVTGHRQAVYFELGFAMGLGIPVILTCRKDCLEGCSFDTRQYNHIVWETPGDLREKLKNRIDATIV